MGDLEGGDNSSCTLLTCTSNPGGLRMTRDKAERQAIGRKCKWILWQASMEAIIIQFIAATTQAVDYVRAMTSLSV